MPTRTRTALLLTAIGLLAAATADALEPGETREWPHQRQPLLAGHYAGTVRDHAQTGQPCEYLDAQLELRHAGRGNDAERDYTLTLHCAAAAASTTRTLRSTWWIDAIGSSCLILMQDPRVEHRYPPEKLYGFRIAGDDMALRQDGSGCDAVDERDARAVLTRVAPDDAGRAAP